MRWGLGIALLASVAAACSQAEDAPAPAPTVDGGGGPYCPPPPRDSTCAKTRAHGCEHPFLSGCVLTCFPGYTDCDQNAQSGCEVSYTDDPKNCGACGASAETCVGGIAGPPPEELFECGATAEGVAVDDTNLYFMCDGVLWSTPKSGGPKTKLIEGELTDARAGLQVVDGFLYWAWRSSAKTGAVRRVATAGGPVETVVTGVNPGSNVLVHAGVAYLIDTDTTGLDGKGHVVDSTGRTLVECGSFGALAAVGDVLYVVNQIAATLSSVRFDGTEAQPLGKGSGIAITDGTVLTLLGATSISYQPGIGFSPPSPLGFVVGAASQRTGDGVAWTRASASYHGDWFARTSLVASVEPKTGRTTVRARVDGADGTVLRARAIGPIAQDATHVYFGTSGGFLRAATISRFAK